MAKESFSAGKILPWLAAAAASYAVVKVFDKLFGKSSEDKSLEATSQTVKKEIQKLQNEGLTPSYSEAQYKTLADTLQNAMVGPGTDENKIFQAINMMKNSLDVMKLVDAFGIRNYYTYSSWTGSMMNLGQWLRSDLNDEGIFIVNKRLASNGIKFQF